MRKVWHGDVEYVQSQNQKAAAGGIATHVLLSEGLNVVPFCWESRLALAITRVLPPWAGRSVQEGTSQDEFLANSGSHLLLPDREAHRNDSKRENGLELLFEHRLPALWEN